MDHTRSTRKTRSVAALTCTLAVAVAWSHVGHHPAPKPPPPIRPPALSPGVFGKGDPTPNRFDTATGLSAGGLAYTWTVNAVGNFNARLTGVVGASSWSDPGSLPAGEGWTRASSWVALRLRSPSRVTIRLSRAAGIIDPLGILPGETGGDDLVPAFALYSGWQGAGAEGIRYPGTASIPWATALTYRFHQRDDGDGIVEGAYILPAGLYTLALGGVGGTGFDAGRQGYVANLSILSRAVPASVWVTARHISKRNTYQLRGRFLNPSSAALLVVQQNGRTRFLPARSASWAVSVSGLKPGANYVYVAAISHDRRVSARKRITIIR